MGVITPTIATIRINQPLSGQQTTTNHVGWFAMRDAGSNPATVAFYPTVVELGIHMALKMPRPYGLASSNLARSIICQSGGTGIRIRLKT